MGCLNLMRTVAPEIEAIKYPIKLLDGQHNVFIGSIGRGFETLGFQALEPQAEAVALPIQHLDAVSGFVEEDEKYGVEHRDLDFQFDQYGQAVDGLSKVHGFGVEVDSPDFTVGMHHGRQAPEILEERSIGLQLFAWNVGFVERIQKTLDTPPWKGFSTANRGDTRCLFRFFSNP